MPFSTSSLLSSFTELVVPLSKIIILRVYLLNELFSRNCVKQNQVKENLKLFPKLFLLMGILWAFEMVSHHVSSRVFSLVFGILNLSRGSFMFIMFILKTSVLKGLKKRFRSKPNQDTLVSDYTRRRKSTISRKKTETSFLED